MKARGWEKGNGGCHSDLQHRDHAHSGRSEPEGGFDILKAAAIARASFAAPHGSRPRAEGAVKRAIGLFALLLSGVVPAHAFDFGQLHHASAGVQVSKVDVDITQTNGPGSASVDETVQAIFAKALFVPTGRPVVLEAILKTGVSGRDVGRRPSASSGPTGTGYAENGTGIQLYGAYRFGREPTYFYAGGGLLYNDQQQQGATSFGPLLLVGHVMPISAGKGGSLLSSLRAGPIKTDADSAEADELLFVAESVYAFRIRDAGTSFLSRLGGSAGLRVEVANGDGSNSLGQTYDVEGTRITLLFGAALLP